MQHWTAGGIIEAEMNVNPVADPGRVENRGENRPLAHPKRGGACHFAGDHGAVGGSQANGRVGSELELAGAKFGHETVGFAASRAQGGDEGFGKAALAAEGVQRIRVAGLVDDAGIGEFMLERG